MGSLQRWVPRSRYNSAEFLKMFFNSQLLLAFIPIAHNQNPVLLHMNQEYQILMNYMYFNELIIVMSHFNPVATKKHKHAESSISIIISCVYSSFKN